MRRLGWMLVALMVGCSGKDDSADTAGTSGASCVSADMSDPDCESGQAVLRIAVTANGSAAPAGTTVYAEDCDGAQNTATADEFGEARFNIPAATYIIWADNGGEGLAATPETHDIPGCGTTSLDVVMSGG